MAEEYYSIPDSPAYDDTAIRKIQDSDPVRASTVVNPVLEQMIENTAAVKKQADELGAQMRDTASKEYVAEALAEGQTNNAEKLSVPRAIDGMPFDGTADITHYGTCGTAAATAAKVVALAGFTLAAGARIAVKFTVTNTAANPTLNVNGTGAKPVYYRGAAIAAGYLAANRTYEFVYNGTQYELVGDIDTNTTYTPAAAAPKAAGTAAVGTSAKYAREDHVHPAQTTVSGNAGTATKLATARTIRTNLASTTAASFDGSANVTPGVTGILPVAYGGTGNSSGYIRTGNTAGGAVGAYSTVEGANCICTGNNSHAEGQDSTCTGENSHVEGWGCTASGTQCHAEGGATQSSSYGSHSEGSDTIASGRCSHAEGYKTTASGNSSHAGGQGTIASSACQMAIGWNNVEYNSGATNTVNSDALFIVGKGASADARANAFRVKFTGVAAAGSYASTGADYAELFEWLDGNPDAEDRAGRFVTLDGEKIRLAGPEDDFVLGIISGNPSVIGDVHDDQWQGMYLYDLYGRPIWEDVEVPAEAVVGPDPENPEKTVTRILIPAHMEHRQKLNPDYDSSQKYIPRSERPEWGCVGMMGKLVAVDDGTCKPNGWCKPGEGGAATACSERTDFRVMERINETHVRVLVLGRR